jgi:(p)ppGpp synthase/HD superfamily hydrolase
MSKTSFNLTFDDLKIALKEYLKDEKHLAVIEDAFSLASKLHFGEKRLNNEEYITHPLGVALYISVNKSGL